VIIGVKYRDQDSGDLTFGWFRYRRDEAGPTSSYALGEWMYHPIPNEPIRAGLPPDLPEPSFAWTEEGLQVSWPESARMLILEMTSSLMPPVRWTPVASGGSTVITLPLDAEEQGSIFFRLVAPAP